jgi:hypothetical protein
VNVYPPVALAVRLRPRVVYTSPVKIHDADPNLELPTSEPTEPNYSISVTSLPSITGDVHSKRYGIAIALNGYFNVTTTTYFYAKAVVGTKTVSGSAYASGTYYRTIILNITGVDLNSVVNLYLWSSGPTVYLRRTVAVVYAIPILADKVVDMLVVSVSSYYVSESVTYGDVTANNILLCHNDIPEVELTGAGTGIIRDKVIKPSILSSDKGLQSGGATTDITKSLVVLYPEIITWVEYE